METSRRSYGAYEDDHLTVGQWMLTLLIIGIPVVNIVMMLIWSFSDSAHTDRRRFSRAYLIFLVIVLALVLAFLLIFGSALMDSSMYEV